MMYPIVHARLAVLNTIKGCEYGNLAFERDKVGGCKGVNAAFGIK
jgi:hypothetical protein